MIAQFGNVREINAAVRCFVKAEAVFGDIDRRNREFDMLNRLELIRGRKFEPLDFCVADFVINRFVNALTEDSVAIMDKIPTELEGTVLQNEEETAVAVRYASKYSLLVRFKNENSFNDETVFNKLSLKYARHILNYLFNELETFKNG